MTAIFATSTSFEYPVQTLADVVRAVPTHAESVSFGRDIDNANSVLLAPDRSEEEKRSVLSIWIGRWQPCLFARMAAHCSRGLEFDLCWIHEWEMDRGREYVTAIIQSERRRWKGRAERGASSGSLTFS
ncbi:MAG: hypothetical protein HKL85_13270 [Acidimicrobiaceae bacterium]|nr:hypothetical protein [Acidimicrobiaceae bacterium]